MIKNAFFLIFSITILLSAKPPELSPKTTRTKIEEVFKAHACHKNFTPELIKRIYINFLDELDPMKTYFLEDEIASWLYPDEESITKEIQSLKKGDFFTFYKIHEKFVSAVERRNEIEGEVSLKPLPEKVKSEEFKDLSWANSKELLADRILRIKALQMDAAEKLEEMHKSQYMQRLQKRRLNREQEFLSENKGDRTKLTLSLVLKATTASLDSHTNYFTPSEANSFMIQVQQRLFGIGAQLRDNLDGLIVVRILDNSPASQSNKIKINDKIIAVNHEPIIGMEITEAVELIRGEKGTQVLLTILRETKESSAGETEKIEVELTRNEVVLEETRLETSVEPYGDGAIAVLKLFSFYQDQKSSSASDVAKAIEEIQKKQDIKGVILDLRSNAGGLLTQAVNVTGLFIHKGIVVSIKDHLGRVQHLREIEGNPVWQGPLLVLINRASASAAEIVAQALQDYGRAIVTGDDHSFGKGSFQTFTLDAVHNPKVNPQGEYKVTRGKYYTVSGKSPQLTGVLSDIVIPGILSQIDIGEEFAKFPLENDSISSHFDDDLSDISPFHRVQLGPLYKHNLQKKLTTYLPFMSKLKENSENRIKASKNYQGFLEELGKKNFDGDLIEIFGQTDLQLTETINVMKDLIFLESQSRVLS